MLNILCLQAELEARVKSLESMVVQSGESHPTHSNGDGYQQQIRELTAKVSDLRGENQLLHSQLCELADVQQARYALDEYEARLR